MESGKERIVSATIKLLQKHGPVATTTDRVAVAAGCAKGLVHYHFRTKSALWSEIVQTLGKRRHERWAKAFSGAKWAVTDTWKIVLADRREGIVRLIASIGGEDRDTDDAISSVTQQFSRTMTEAVRRFLDRMEMDPGVPIEQLGWSLSSVLHGTIIQLDAKPGRSPRVLSSATPKPIQRRRNPRR